MKLCALRKPNRDVRIFAKLNNANFEIHLLVKKENTSMSIGSIVPLTQVLGTIPFRARHNRYF
jgi:hypothetical protein